MPDIIKPNVVAMLALPPVKWAEHCESLSGDDLYNLEVDLCRNIATMARLRGYVDARVCGGDHRSGVYSSNLFASKVRKLLGFSYPKDDMTF